MDQVIAPGDIAIYGTLCALSSLPRSALKAQLLENSVFGLYIEQEPYVRELIEAYMGSNFKTVLELLSRYSVCHKKNLSVHKPLLNINLHDPDPASNRHSPCTTRPRPYKPHSKLGCRAVLPAIRDYPTRPYERCIRVDCRRSGGAGRWFNPERKYPGAGRQSKQGTFRFLRDEKRHVCSKVL